MDSIAHGELRCKGKTVPISGQRCANFVPIINFKIMLNIRTIHAILFQQKNWAGGITAVKLSEKLDLLQILAVKYADDPHKRYLIGLLAEHAEEDEMSAEFLVWIKLLFS